MSREISTPRDGTSCRASPIAAPRAGSGPLPQPQPRRAVAGDPDPAPPAAPLQGKEELPDGLWEKEDKDKDGFISWEEATVAVSALAPAPLARRLPARRLMSG